MRRGFPLIACLAVSFAGCPSGDDAPSDAGPDAAPCELVVTLGTGGPAERFVPFSAHDVAEVIVGYQGFIFIQTILAIEPVPAGQVIAPFTLVMDGREPFGETKRVDLTDGDDGSAYSPPLTLYFNDFPLPELVGQRLRVDVQIDRDGCSGRFATELELRDDNPCIHVVDDPEETACQQDDQGE
jgi:hypothetical protein